jgi:hypothetical protein
MAEFAAADGTTTITPCPGAMWFRLMTFESSSSSFCADLGIRPLLCSRASCCSSSSLSLTPISFFCSRSCSFFMLQRHETPKAMAAAAALTSRASLALTCRT